MMFCTSTLNYGRMQEEFPPFITSAALSAHHNCHPSVQNGSIAGWRWAPAIKMQIPPMRCCSSRFSIIPSFPDALRAECVWALQSREPVQEWANPAALPPAPQRAGWNKSHRWRQARGLVRTRLIIIVITGWERERIRESSASDLMLN